MRGVLTRGEMGRRGGIGKTNGVTLMARNTIYSRAVLYSDGGSIETGVAFDPTYRLGDDDQAYFHIKGVGSEELSVRVDHIPYLIEWLQDVAAADEAYRVALQEAAQKGAR
jgi:hypothetical protein